MTTDAWLAIAHHLTIFSMAAMLAAEWGIVRPGVSVGDLVGLGRIDILYGASAGLVITAGIARLVWGDQPFDFYSDNPFFWLKMASLGTVGVLSVVPTMRYIRWQRAAEHDQTSPPAVEDVTRMRRLIHIQMAVFATIPVWAALMARGIGR